MWSIFNHPLFASSCLLCRQQAAPQGICSRCEAQLPRLEHACAQCGRPLADPTVTICGSCIKQTPHVDRTLVPFLYAPPLAPLIRQLKFHQGLHLAHLLGEQMAALIEPHLQARPQVLLPVPLHPRRMRKRGYNQAQELARALSRRLQIPIDNRLCVRSRHTREQSQLSPSERRRNIRRAFCLRGKTDYRHVAIIDDVITTGSTVNELARVLKRAGITRVEVWGCCHA